MAATLQFDLVSPERRLASVSATEVQIPGTDGDMTAMAGHAATITTLRPGILKAVSAEGTKSFVVTGGFAEVSPTSATILAEQAVPKGQGDKDMVAALVASAEAAHAEAPAEGKQLADQLRRDAKQLASQLGA